MVKFYKLLVVFLYFHSMFSQEEILIRGAIEANSLQEGTVHIINTTRGTGTTNVPGGSFEILVREGDVLWFSSVQYQKHEIKINRDQLTNPFIKIFLEEVVNELDEVRISNIGLTGNLQNDVGSLKKFDKYTLGVPLNKEPLPTQAERRLASQGNYQIGLTSAAVPLERLINSMSGKLARLKLIKAHEDLAVMVEKVIETFSAEFFLDYLHVPKEALHEFLYYCVEKVQLRKHLEMDNELELIEYLQKAAGSFLKFRTED